MSHVAYSGGDIMAALGTSSFLWHYMGGIQLYQVTALMVMAFGGVGSRNFET